MTKGRLILIPSNLGDLSAENQFPADNIQWIQRLTYFFVENPKPARAFLKSVHSTIKFDEIVFFQHDKHQANQDELYNSVLEVLVSGNDVGVLSDAGCPGIADPGSEMVAMAHKNNVDVIPLVGPSSILLTLMASGLNGQQFQFIGYLPKDQNQRLHLYRKIAEDIRKSSNTYLFIETPYHNDQTFKEVLKHFPSDIRLVMGIDIMSGKQSIQTRSISEWARMKNMPVLKGRQVVFGLGG